MAHFTDRDMQRKGPCGVPWGVDVQTLRRGSLASLALVALACGEGMACCGRLGPRPREQGGWKALPPSLSGQAAWVLRSLSPRGFLTAGAACPHTPSWARGPDSGPPRRPQ